MRIGLNLDLNPGSLNLAKKAMLLTALVAGSLSILPAARSDPQQVSPTPTQAAASRANNVSPYRPAEVESSSKYYQSVWGIDNLLVRQTASGSLIRFSYRVTHPELAKAISDDRATPYLYGQRSHALLTIPVMEKVGSLRQSRQAKAGKEYWMTFSNKGHLVRVGDRVDVIIGAFHAVGLMVE